MEINSILKKEFNILSEKETKVLKVLLELGNDVNKSEDRKVKELLLKVDEIMED